MDSRPQSARQILREQSIVAIFGSGLLYGAWAFWVNREVSLIHGVMAALTQFCLSAIGTSVLVFGMTAILDRGQALRHKLAAIFVPLNVLTVLFGSIHWLVGTPNVLTTIAPSYVVGTLFCIAFTVRAGRALSSTHTEPTS